MKKVLIIPNNTDLNRGDQALVWESIRLVKDVYQKDVECILMSDLATEFSSIQNRQTKELGYQFIDTILKHPGRKFGSKESDSKTYSILTLLQWGAQAVVDFFSTRLILSENRLIRKIGYLFLNETQKETIRVMENVDSIFVKGGGFLHSYGGKTDSYTLYYLTFHIRLAQALGKRVIILPNSVGPLNNTIARKIVVKTLLNCSLVTVREQISKKCLDELKIPSLFFPDLGFFLSPSDRDMKDYLKQRGIPLDGKCIVITMRPYRFQGFSDPNQLYDKYIFGMKFFIEEVVSEGYHVTLMSHTLGPSSHENDSLALKDLMQHLSEKTLSRVVFIEDFGLDCKDVERIYSYYDYMVGTRFHSVIFALNVGVPAVAIAYGGNKGKGMMGVLGNNEYLLDMDKVSGQDLLRIFKHLEVDKEHYLINLKNKKAIINQEREALIKKIQEVLFL